MEPQFCLNGQQRAPSRIFPGLDTVTAIKKYHESCTHPAILHTLKWQEKIAQSLSSLIISWTGFRTEPGNLNVSRKETRRNDSK